MAPSGRIATVYSVSASGKPDKLDVKDVAQVAVEDSYTSLVPAALNGRLYLLGYGSAQDHFDIYEFTPSAPWIAPTAAKPVIGKAKDIINGFTLGNQPYLGVYTAQNGVFETYSLQSDLSLSAPYEFYRNHELAISKGFTTVKFFTQLGQVVFLGYNIVTGYVAMYTASITPVSPNPGTLPLLMLPIWSHPWAPGWTRFAFFQFGGENFFLKTNVANPKKLNVNIDHVLDALGAGTAEVGTLLTLADALNLTNVEPFTLGGGEPYFVTYVSSSGAATLNRFHGDCQGWTTVAAFDAPVGSSVVVPLVTADGAVFILFA